MGQAALGRSEVFAPSLGEAQIPQVRAASAVHRGRQTP